MSKLNIVNSELRLRDRYETEGFMMGHSDCSDIGDTSGGATWFELNVNLDLQKITGFKNGYVKIQIESKSGYKAYVKRSNNFVYNNVSDLIVSVSENVKISEGIYHFTRHRECTWPPDTCPLCKPESVDLKLAFSENGQDNWEDFIIHVTAGY